MFITHNLQYKRFLQVSRNICISPVGEGETIMLKTIPVSEFVRNFGRYRMKAQREIIAVTSHGQITGYFIGPVDYEEFRRFQEDRRTSATAERPEDQSQALSRSSEDSSDAHLVTIGDTKDALGPDSIEKSSEQR
jgi:hypothetical protein